MNPVWLSVLLHLFIGWRIAPQLPGTLAPLAFGALLLLSALLIPAAFMGRRARDRRVADRWSWAGMLALGLFSMLIVLTLLRELLLLALLPFDLPPLAAPSALAVPALALLGTLLGLLNARRTAGVRRVDVPIAGLPPALQGFRIAQISDVHVGPTVKAGYVQAIVDRGQPPAGRCGGHHRRSGRWPGGRPSAGRGAVGRSALAPRQLLRHRQP